MALALQLGPLACQYSKLHLTCTSGNVLENLSQRFAQASSSALCHISDTPTNIFDFDYTRFSASCLPLVHDFGTPVP